MLIHLWPLRDFLSFIQCDNGTLKKCVFNWQLKWFSNYLPEINDWRNIFLDRTKLLFDFWTIQLFFEISKHFYLLAMYWKTYREFFYANQKKILIMFHDLTFLVSAGNFLRVIFSLTRYSAGLLHHWLDLCFLIFATFFSLSRKDSTRKRLKHFLDQKNVEQKYFPQKKTFQRKLIAQWKSHQITEATLFFGLFTILHWCYFCGGHQSDEGNIKPNRCNVFWNATTTIPSYLPFDVI